VHKSSYSADVLRSISRLVCSWSQSKNIPTFSSATPSPSKSKFKCIQYPKHSWPVSFHVSFLSVFALTISFAVPLHLSVTRRLLLRRPSKFHCLLLLIPNHPRLHSPPNCMLEDERRIPMIPCSRYACPISTCDRKKDQMSY